MMRSTSGFSTSRLLRALAAVAIAVAVASTLVAYEAVSRSPGASVAGEAKMQMLRDEHALIAAYVANGDEARRLANAAADNDIARMRLAAQGEARRQADIAAVEPAQAAPAAEARTVALRTPERAAPARAVARDLAVAEPLQLAQSAVPQAAQPAQQRVMDGPVRSRLRELASDVRRIPSLLQSAAHWVADAVPAPKLPSLPSLPTLPMRQFSAAI